MIRHILKKDWNLLWQLVALQVAIQIALSWDVYKSGFFGEDVAANALLRPLMLAWYAAIAAVVTAVVHQDPVPGVDQDWLIRPLKRTDLLSAKVLFVLMTVSAPMFVLDLLHAHALGFVWPMSARHALFKEFYVFVCLIVPILALAASTRNMTELITLGATLIVVYAVSTLIGGLVFGPNHCPTCGTGVEWIQHLLQHAGLFAGAIVVLTLQYRRRLTTASLVLLVCGAVALVFLQLPWKSAFALQTRLQESASKIPVGIAFDAEAASGSDKPTGENPGGASQAAHALLRGDVGRAVEYLRRRGRSTGIPVAADLPLRIDHVPPGNLVLFDRSELHLLDPRGRNLYSETNASPPSWPDPNEAGRDSYLAHQTLYLPAEIAKSMDERTRLRIDYYMTLVAPSGTYRVAAIGGDMRAPEAGVCATHLNQSDAIILLRCKQVGRLPFCYSATLYGPDGHADVTKSSCSPDYRPYLPPISVVSSLYGLLIPIPDRYLIAHHTVDTSQLGRSHLLVKFYAARGHFTRSVEIDNFPLHRQGGDQPRVSR